MEHKRLLTLDYICHQSLTNVKEPIEEVTKKKKFLCLMKRGHPFFFLKRL